MDGAITDYVINFDLHVVLGTYIFLYKKGMMRARLELDPDRWRYFSASHVLPFV